MNPVSALIPSSFETQPRAEVRARRSVTVPNHVALVSGGVCNLIAAAAVVDACIEHGVGCLSLSLGAESLSFLRLHAVTLARSGVRISAEAGCDAEVLAMIASLPAPAAHETFLRLHLLADAGGNMQIARTLQRLAEEIQRGELQPDALTREAFERELDSSDLPPVDLLLHTADAPRLSRTLLWKAAYAELFFSDARFEHFRAAHVDAALADYAQRRRTFGGLK